MPNTVGKKQATKLERKMFALLSELDLKGEFHFKKFSFNDTKSKILHCEYVEQDFTITFLILDDDKGSYITNDTFVINQGEDNEEEINKISKLILGKVKTFFYWEG